MSKMSWKMIIYTCVLTILVMGLSGCGNNDNNTANGGKNGGGVGNNVGSDVGNNNGSNVGNQTGNDTDNHAGNHADNGTTTAAGDAVNGEVIYTNNCLPCHGKGGENGGSPNLVKSEISKDPNQIYDRVMNGIGGMPAFKGRLSEEEINDVVAYVNQVAK